MNRHLPFFLLSFAIIPVSVHASFERSAMGARSQAMGGAFVALADDGSALFLNPAGIVSGGSIVLYGDWARISKDGEQDETKVDIVVPASRTAFGLGWYRVGPDGGLKEDLMVAGVARKLLEGTQGSFLSVGASFRLGRISYEAASGCRCGGTSESEATGDLGLLFRPLPVISFGFSMENLRQVEFSSSGTKGKWQRVNRWGICYFWEEKVTLSFEQEHTHGFVVRHYGFSLRAAVPLELMAGFSRENVYGGARWVGGRVRITVAFSSEETSGVDTRASVEIIFRRAGKDGSK